MNPAKKLLEILKRRTARYHGYSPKLRMWHLEALSEEEGVKVADDFPLSQDYAIYPRTLYQRVALLKTSKLYDYCFIGAFKINKLAEARRKWIIPFIRNNFTPSSYLQFTDIKTVQLHERMGAYDYTGSRNSFCPREHSISNRNFFDENYFLVMSQSEFCLCPGGDACWSMRFLESVMCRSIPIVRSREETFRSKCESRLDYKYYLIGDNHVFRKDWVEHNYSIFLRHHTLSRGLIEQFE